MSRTITAVLAVAALALVGCSSSDDGKPAKATATVTATKTPTVSAAGKRQACVDAWGAWLDERPADYDPDTDPLPVLPACEGRADSAELGFEALRERNQANRDDLDACLDDPGCTAWPVP